MQKLMKDLYMYLYLITDAKFLHWKCAVIGF